MTTTKSTKRQLIEQAQGMADHEQRVMVVVRTLSGERYIRAAAELGVRMDGTDWMARHNMAGINVVAPTGTVHGLSAEQVLRAALA